MTVETPEAQAQTNGSSGATIPVENPATGQTIAHVPDMSSEEVTALVARARAAQPAWEALGFEGRRSVMLEARKWLVENRERMIETVVEESGKTFEDAQLAEVFFCADSLGFWGKVAAKYLADEKVKTHSAAPDRQEADPALPPSRRDRRDRAVELPAHEQLRRLHPGADGRQHGGAQAQRGHAADVAPDGRGHARGGLPRGRVPRGHRPRRRGRGADRHRRLRDVHRLGCDRPEGGRQGRRDA